MSIISSGLMAACGKGANQEFQSQIPDTHNYEEIIGGRLWAGKDAEILASDRVDLPNEPGPVRFEHICKTPQGAWFIFHVAVDHGMVLERDLYPCDEATAKQRLERHQDVYVRCFGRPAAA